MKFVIIASGTHQNPNIITQGACACNKMKVGEEETEDKREHVTEMTLTWSQGGRPAYTSTNRETKSICVRHKNF
jgi:hypothetical protein